VNGELIGDPLDVKMFESTNWVLEEPQEGVVDELILAYVKPPQQRRMHDRVDSFTSNDKSPGGRTNGLY
jgi:hypothetical protein